MKHRIGLINLILMLVIFASNLCFYDYGETSYSTDCKQSCLVFDTNLTHNNVATVNSKYERPVIPTLSKIQFEQINIFDFPEILSLPDYFFQKSIQLSHYNQETFKPPIYL